MHTLSPLAARVSSETLTGGAQDTIRGPVDDREHPTPTARLGGAYTCFDTLGTGGTAVVRRAHQAVLDREVAIKTPLNAAGSPAMVARVLQEAWVTGALEHPGVVPVHDVVVDDEGCPHIIMRRIAGWTWTELINTPDAVERAFGVRDLLGWHLRVLMAVAATVHHAHQRGVLHRDLKPDNVMIGAAGEAYVLDWGIAVALDDRAAHRLPRAANQTHLAGTPHFMAPEMACADGSALGVPTDVYLLGGLLYAVLTRDHPHHGDSVQAVVDAAAVTPPAPPEGPARLRELCRRALALDPVARPPTAEAFRREVQDYLEARDADALVEAGNASLAALLATSAASPSDAVHAPFAGARLAFEQALSRSPGHTEALAGLRTARLHVARWELDNGDPAAATRALADVSDPPAELTAAIARASEEAARRAEAGSKLLADHDESAGIRTRSFVSLLLGVVFTVTPLYAGLAHRNPSMWELGLSMAAILGVVLGLWFWARDSLGRSVINRSFIRTIAVAPFVELLLVLGADAMGLPPESVVALFSLLTATVALAVAATLDPWMLVAALGYLASYWAGVQVPALRWEFLAAANVLLTAVALARWGPEGLRSWIAFRASRKA